MRLTKTELEMLKGNEGPAVKKAMEILVALGKIYGAERMVPITSAQVSGVSYKNLGDAGIEFLAEWADAGANVRVPTTLNPAGMDLKNWKELGISEAFAKKQLEIIKAFERMGVEISCTCTPYFAGNCPRRGEHIAWSESSAVSFANSVLGAYTNREGGPSALAAAIAGRTPLYGYHLEENRRATLVVDVEFEPKNQADFGAMGYLVGKEVKGGVPLFRGIKEANLDQLKMLGASMAASGAVALYYVEGMAQNIQTAPTPKNMKITEWHIRKAYDEMNSDGKKFAKQICVAHATDSRGIGHTPESAIRSRAQTEGSVACYDEKIDLVALGCPHCSIDELRQIAKMLGGKKIKSGLWVCTSRKVADGAKEERLIIEKSGGKVVCDTCMVVAPLEEMGCKNIAVNSGKAAFYLPTHCKANVRFGSMEKCIEAAIKGKWNSKDA